jgi:basic membrane protein A
MGIFSKHLSTFVLLALLPTLTALAEPLKVGLVLDKGGRDDKSFNAAAFKGASDAQKTLGIQLKVVEASQDSEFEPSLRTFAQHGFGLIMAIGFAATDAVKKVSAEFPKVNFLLVDAKVGGPNVRSISFKEQDGSYLMGVLAGLASKSKVVGFIGGMDVPLIRRFEMGYRAGALSVDPKIKVLTNFVGSTSTAWRDPSKGKELAMAQYKKNADVTFTAAGASGLGAFDAAEELHKLVIGCDSNQNWVKPGYVLTSMLKRVDKAVNDTINLVAQGKFEAGVVEWGLKEGGVDFALDKDNRALITPAMEKKVNEVKKLIESGKIKVPDYYLQGKG